MATWTSPPLSKGFLKYCPPKHTGHCWISTGAQEPWERGWPYLVGKDDGDRTDDVSEGTLAASVTFQHSCSILSTVFSISTCNTPYHWIAWPRLWWNSSRMVPPCPLNVRYYYKDIWTHTVINCHLKQLTCHLSSNHINNKNSDWKSGRSGITLLKCSTQFSANKNIDDWARIVCAISVDLSYMSPLETDQIWYIIAWQSLSVIIASYHYATPLHFTIACAVIWCAIVVTIASPIVSAGCNPAA